jgi:hypothetical protein
VVNEGGQDGKGKVGVPSDFEEVAGKSFAVTEVGSDLREVWG